eukprot:TRINITY_DN14532_c0_g1_i1.p1 TRINITY_DN14532_c0_g1~~TRINITY_DN14532_c0_g1_i1.p1  ORF type:complete len:108 (+),score=35.66 TRINITY_DN14532_c0_g1_i1:49-372(+)
MAPKAAETVEDVNVANDTSIFRTRTPWYGWVLSACFWLVMFFLYKVFFEESVEGWNEQRVITAFTNTYLWLYGHAVPIGSVLMALLGLMQSATLFSGEKTDKKKKRR